MRLTIFLFCCILASFFMKLAYGADIEAFSLMIAMFFLIENMYYRYRLNERKKALIQAAKQLSVCVEELEKNIKLRELFSEMTTDEVNELKERVKKSKTNGESTTNG